MDFYVSYNANNKLNSSSILHHYTYPSFYSLPLQLAFDANNNDSDHNLQQPHQYLLFNIFVSIHFFIFIHIIPENLNNLLLQETEGDLLQQPERLETMFCCLWAAQNWSGSQLHHRAGIRAFNPTLSSAAHGC
ncbi:uncharacterized protein LOC121771636 [Salvia splendens]|uniref:uncharacterized protein LOC121771636 n=1 Tax=Salvia splendens TaxID=180675 RepID=UPI001C262497|nr:uncharacterized protein LOC121771636 [Salvia splendens]